MKEITPDRLERDLGPRLDGEIRAEPVMRALYSTAACIYRVPPLGIVFPRGADDVSAVLRYAAEEGIAVTARGAGSGVAGQCLGRGIILDFTRHMNRILDLDRDARRVRVEPGVVYATLNRHLRAHGLFFPPDPSSGEFCTIGGMLANNSGGAHSVLYGTTADHVASVSMVLPGGDAYTARCLDDREAATDRLAGAVAGRLGALSGRIADRRPRTTKNASGYNIWDVLDDGTVDMARLVVGSEGTLGVFTEARLKVSRLPGARVTALVCFGGLEEMAEAAREIRSRDPATIELMEKSLIDLLSGSDASDRLQGLPPAMEAILLVEVSGRDGEEAEARARACLDGLRGPGGALDVRLAVDEPGQERLWEIRNRASSIFRLIHHPEKPLRFIEDGAVAVDRLPDYIRRLRGVLSAHGLRAMIFGHAGDGNVHVNPFVDVTRGDYRARIRDVATEVAAVVIDLRGTLTGEHGDGRLRTPFLPDLYGEEICGLFGGIKALFDPSGIMNPGIIAGGGAAPMTDALRYGWRAAIPGEGPTDATRIEIDKCHGCGNCRAYCPPFSAFGTEASTARAKANLLREFRIGEILGPEAPVSSLFRETMALCVNCRLCLTECPTRVDIPGLAIQARAGIHRRTGFSRTDRFLMASGAVAAAAGRLPGLSSLALRSPPVRWVMDRVVGIDRRRTLPAFDRHGTRRPVAGTAGGAPGDAVYFPGCFGRHHDRAGERAGTIALLERAGYRVRIYEGPCCGVARLTIGDLDGFCRRARAWIAGVEAVAGAEAPIVFSAPSCLMCVREEYSARLGDEPARAVAARAVDVLEVVAGREGFPGPASAVAAGAERVLLQLPCHVRANGTEEVFLRTMGSLAGLDVAGVLRHCCGLSGTFGMRRERFDDSMRIGAPLFAGIRTAAARPDGVAPVVITPCGSCRMQIEQGTGVRTEHPAERLAGWGPGSGPGSGREPVGRGLERARGDG